MNFNSLKYLLKEGLRNLLNNIFMTLASVGVLTACLLLVGFSIVFKNNMENMIKKMGQESVVSIYFKDEAKPEQIEEMKNILNSNENVESVNHITKEAALEIFKKNFNNKSATEILTKENVLPVSLSIHIKNVEKMEEILNIAKEEKYKNIIEEIKAPTKFAEMMQNINKTTKLIGTILIISFIIAALVIISNTIRAAVFARRREIAIMKQVGATDNFVRFPFLIEGAMIGLISATIAFFLMMISYKIIYSTLINIPSEFLKMYFKTMIPFKKISTLLASGYIIFGVFTGSMGSFISLRRHLKI